MDIKKYTKCRPFLCLRRGVSLQDTRTLWERCFSLPTQRCFYLSLVNLLHQWLFSAYAEVFLVKSLFVKFFASFLCLRRGVSHTKSFHLSLQTFSLPTQRCFRLSLVHKAHASLFSAYAEVFLDGVGVAAIKNSFLCLRRGVSLSDSATSYCRHFSLPTQRCFRHHFWLLGCSSLFSAYAEVFLHGHSYIFLITAFLCLRRGVSNGGHSGKVLRCFSLPTQRCFIRPYPSAPEAALFSAYAEVFLRADERKRVRAPFLCLRRGVSSAAGR